ncbi:MAG: hypothetical protein ACR652_14585 [Methylocystis sp.]|uniref:hypothetical protein n=1 Tax=Methylocystis sp. TaxID=1911079 RepID=UPI003DA44E63
MSENQLNAVAMGLNGFFEDYLEPARQGVAELNRRLPLYIKPLELPSAPVSGRSLRADTDRAAQTVQEIFQLGETLAAFDARYPIENRTLGDELYKSATIHLAHALLSSGVFDRDNPDVEMLFYVAKSVLAKVMDEFHSNEIIARRGRQAIEKCFAEAFAQAALKPCHAAIVDKINAARPPHITAYKTPLNFMRQRDWDALQDKVEETLLRENIRWEGGALPPRAIQLIEEFAAEKAQNLPDDALPRVDELDAGFAAFYCVFSSMCSVLSLSYLSDEAMSGALEVISEHVIGLVAMDAESRKEDDPRASETFDPSNGRHNNRESANNG